MTVESIFGFLVLQETSVDDEGVFDDKTLSPVLGGVELVSSLDGSEGSLDEISSGSGGALSFGVDIVNTCEVEQLLGDWRSNQSSSAGGRHQSHLD